MSSLIVEVVRINELEKHPNADTLLIATVRGWKCIVKDGEFKLGDLAVYVPIDAVIPPNVVEQYGLTYLKKGERVRTIKLRGYISQGLLLPLPPGASWREGQDVARILGITKWEPPARPAQGLTPGQRPSTVKNPNPWFHKYVDIENHNNYPDVFGPDDEVVITEKVHGTNLRAGWVPVHPRSWWSKLITKLTRRQWEFVVGSHNVQLYGRMNAKHFYKETHGNLYVEAARLYDLPRKLPKGIVIYGEVYGKGIQDLTYGLDDIDVVFFDAKRNGQYLDYEEFDKLCKELGLPTAPVLYKGRYGDTTHVSTYASGDSILAASKGTKQMREGCVIKCLKDTNHPRIGRKILKYVSTDYLLRQNGTEYH